MIMNFVMKKYSELRLKIRGTTINLQVSDLKIQYLEQSPQGGKPTYPPSQ